MKISKFFPPYFKKDKLDKCSLNASYQKKSGVYIIKRNSTNEIIYVGYSGNNLYRTIYRHFQEHNDKEQERFLFTKYSCTIRVLLSTPIQAEKWEKVLILKYNPKFNKNKYDKIKAKKEEINFDVEEFNPIAKKEYLNEECPF
jgi:excinuclease UvrABC nuclease subunit